MKELSMSALGDLAHTDGPRGRSLALTSYQGTDPENCDSNPAGWVRSFPVTRRATALEKWFSPGTPRAYLQRLL